MSQGFSQIGATMTQQAQSLAGPRKQVNSISAFVAEYGNNDQGYIPQAQYPQSYYQNSHPNMTYSDEQLSVAHKFFNG